MAMFENFPYTDLHNLNLDWIIKIAKDFLDQYTHIQQLISEGEESLQNLTEEGLQQLQDKADNIELLLNEWYNTHSEDIANQLASALNDLNDWYTSHLALLNQEMQSILISFNQQASAKVAELLETIPADYTELAYLAERTHNNLLRYNASNLLNMMEDYSFSGTYYGITIEYDPVEDCFILNGTSNATGNVNVYVDNAHIINGLIPGKPFICRLTRSNVNVQAEVFAYYNSNWNNLIQITYNNPTGIVQRILPSNTEGMLIRISIPNATTFTNEKIKLEIIKDFIVEFNGIVGNIATIGANADVFEYFLQHDNRVCFVTAGEHILDRSLRMAYGSSLIGLNYNTSIIIPPDNQTDAIIIENVARTVIENLNIQGLVTNIADDPGTFGAGIKIIGHDTANEPRLHIIKNCQIHFFQGGAIVLNNNSYWVANSVTITGCELWRNYAGIWIMPKAEYNRISDCLIYSNYLGIRNDGGNNKFINCDLTENNVGFYITTGATINNGHGSIIGCSINHSNSNNGFAFIIRSVQNGFIVDGCNIWYGKIIVSDSSGIIFSDCLIGNAGTPEIESDDNDSIMFNGCSFRIAPTVQHYNANTFFNNCYTFDGTPVTLA